MKKLLLIFLSFVSWTAANAQDKIITIKQDTIECRIISVNAERISFEQKTPDHQLIGKSIPTSQVSHYLRSGDTDLFSGLGYVKARRLPPEHRWLFSLQGGPAYSLTDYSAYEKYLTSAGNPKSASDDYIGKLKNGYHLNTSIHYLLTNFFGLGLDYNLFYSSSKGEFLSQGYGMSNVPFFTKLTLDERIYAHFTGVSVLFQQFEGTNKKLRISQTLSPGIVQFRSETRGSQYQQYWGDRDTYYGQLPQYYDTANNVSKGTSFGAKGSLAIDYSITPQLSAGLSGSFMWAEIHKIAIKTAAAETEDQELEKAINISHIDYGFIVRYKF